MLYWKQNDGKCGSLWIAERGMDLRQWCLSEVWHLLCDFYRWIKSSPCTIYKKNNRLAKSLSVLCHVMFLRVKSRQVACDGIIAGIKLVQCGTVLPQTAEGGILQIPWQGKPYPLDQHYQISSALFCFLLEKSWIHFTAMVRWMARHSGTQSFPSNRNCV